MIIATGRVVGGKVVLEGESLTEGSVVTVIAGENDGTFDVSDGEERALLAAIAQAERGEVVSWVELMLPRKHSGLSSAWAMRHSSRMTKPCHTRHRDHRRSGQKGARGDSRSVFRGAFDGRNAG